MSVNSKMTAIADAIRSLLGITGTLGLDAMATKLNGITKKTAASYTPGTADQTINAGQYLSGAQTIKGDANLVAANIAKGATIFGVAGEHEGGIDGSDISIVLGSCGTAQDSSPTYDSAGDEYYWNATAKSTITIPEGYKGIALFSLRDYQKDPSSDEEYGWPFTSSTTITRISSIPEPGVAYTNSYSKHIFDSDRYYIRLLVAQNQLVAVCVPA